MLSHTLSLVLFLSALTAFDAKAASKATLSRSSSISRVKNETPSSNTWDAEAPSIQIRAGAGFANLNQNHAANDTQSYGTLSGINASVNLDLPIGSIFSANLGVGLVQKGVSTSTTGTYSFSANTQINYLEIPLMAKANFGSKFVRVNVGAGPYLGLKLNTTTSLTQNINGKSIDIPLQNNVKDYYGSDFGIRSGIGAEFPTGNLVSILVNADYDFGLNNINTAPQAAGTTSTNEIKTSTFIASAGLGIKL